MKDLNAKGFLGVYEKRLFWPIVIIYCIIIISSLILPQKVASILAVTQEFILLKFNWLILLVGSATIILNVWMMFGPYRHVKLGKPDEKPEFSFFTWIAMMFCTCFGTGFVIFGAAEPMVHLFQAPTLIDAGTAGTYAGAVEAIRLSVWNWAFLGIPIFAMGGWAIGYPAYRYNKPLRTSTGLYAILGDRCNDTVFSKIVDVLAGIAIVGGVSMMIGLGVASITFALKILFGVNLGGTAQVAVMLFLIIAYIISTATGLQKGIKYLSQSNIYLALFLFVAVLFVGHAPFQYIMNLAIQTLGELIFRLPQNLFWIDATQLEPRPWTNWWFAFYTLWNICYIPFCGGFIARISRGRTMQEYIFGATIVPTTMVLLWFSAWGGNAIFSELTGLTDLYSVVQQSPEQALYLLLDSYPFGVLLSFVALIVFCLFGITTADSASFFMSLQTSQTNDNPALGSRIVWGLIIGLTGIILQIAGGFSAIKALAIVAASPFVIVAVLYLYCIIKNQIVDDRKEN